MNITNLKKITETLGAEALVVEQEDYRFYITGFESSFGVVVADSAGVTFYTDSRYLEAAQKSLLNSGIVVLEYPGIKLWELLKKYKKIAMPLNRISANEYTEMCSRGYALVDCAPALAEEMSVKNEAELKNIKAACEATDKAFLDLLPKIKEGMTENEVAALLEYLMRIYGASGTSFATICAFGANGSVPHHETGMTKLKYGDPILLDFGCKIGGYCSDCTRTFLFGDDKKHEDFKKVYEDVLVAHMLVKEKFHAGMTGCEGDAIARDYLAERNLAKYFTHSLGHSLGVNIHESPCLSPKDKSVFKNGMVFSDEPGVYIAGQLGIRIEDTVTLVNDRVVSITDSDKKLRIL